MKTSKTKKIKWSFFVFFVPVFLWLFLLIVLPHIELVRISFLEKVRGGGYAFSLNNYAEFFTEPIYWLTFVRTALYSIAVTFIVLVIALPVSFYISKIVNVTGKGFLTVLLLLPFWVSELIRVYGWMILLRESGVINNVMMGLGFWSQPKELLYNDTVMIMGLVYTFILFMIMPLLGVMDSLDDSYIEASFDLGAKKLITWRKIIIPHCMPGIVSGSIVVFMLVLGSYLTPVLMGGKNSLWFTEQIYNQFILYLNWEQGASFGFMLLLLSSFIIWIGLKLTGQQLGEVIEQ